MAFSDGGGGGTVGRAGRRRPFSGVLLRLLLAEVFADLLERLVLGLGQINVEVHQTAEPRTAEQHERVVEPDGLFQVLVVPGHAEAQDEVYGGDDVAAQRLAPESGEKLGPVVSRVSFSDGKIGTLDPTVVRSTMVN